MTQCNLAPPAPMQVHNKRAAEVVRDAAMFEQT